jgi:hypothetical protein
MRGQRPLRTAEEEVIEGLIGLTALALTIAAIVSRREAGVAGSRAAGATLVAFVVLEALMEATDRSEWKHSSVRRPAVPL